MQNSSESSVSIRDEKYDSPEYPQWQAVVR